MCRAPLCRVASNLAWSSIGRSWRAMRSKLGVIASERHEGACCINFVFGERSGEVQRDREREMLIFKKPSMISSFEDLREVIWIEVFHENAVKFLLRFKEIEINFSNSSFGGRSKEVIVPVLFASAFPVK